MMEISINSEIGNLEGVLIHKPGVEVERMKPSTVHDALYNDILSKQIVSKEYEYFEGVLSQFATTYEIKDLLLKVLCNENVRLSLIKESCILENCRFLEKELMDLSADELVVFLIEGYPYIKGKHPIEYEAKRYILNPLYNLFYTRDTSASIFNEVIINPMTFKVRERERLILSAIFENHFKAKTISPLSFSSEAKTEGGDILVIREDILCIGLGLRTNRKGIEFMVDHFRKKKDKFTILVQELPKTQASFIHLDMTFTLLDKDKCMIYEPLIMKQPGYEQYTTTCISLDNGKVTYNEKPTLLDALKEKNIDLNPIACGGNDTWNQDREQWHSGANFFALGEGKIIGYERNNHTIEALNNNGFSILKAEDICSGNINLNHYKTFVVCLQASELPRGGGGARCMTMPLRRKEVNW